jgi:arginine/serine-rich splicing factor 4/5/6
VPVERMSSDGGSPRRGGSSRRDSRSPEKHSDDARKSPDEGPDEENNRTIFCGNIDDRDGEKEIRGWFEKYGTVDRVDMKGKFAFVYMPSKRCAEKAIKELDRTNPGGGLALRVEFTRGDGETKRREEARKAEAMNNPTKTLFLANFDAQGTRSSQLEEAFGEFGKVRGADIRKNFAFIDFDTVEEAIKAKEALNGKQMFGG